MLLMCLVMFYFFKLNNIMLDKLFSRLLALLLNVLLDLESVQSRSITLIFINSYICVKLPGHNKDNFSDI